MVDVGQLSPTAEGTYQVSLEGALPAGVASGRDQLVVSLKGSLPTARIDLEGGPRGAVGVASPERAARLDGAPHRAALLRAAALRRAALAAHALAFAGRALRGLSVELGQEANAPGATGQLWVDGLQLE